MEVLNNIIRLKEELDALRPISPEQEQRIMQKFRLDWNYHSNHLEGNSLTYGETKALILFGITAQGKPLKDHIEMTGHNEALKMLEEIVKEERPLSEHFIRELHVLLLKEPYYVDAVTPDGSPSQKQINVGQYKTSPNHVKTITGEMFYFATPEETPSKMTDLIDWYREKSTSGELHPLLLAAEFHYKFVCIHPFDDGNGRMARILMNFILMQHSFPPVIIKSENKKKYFIALQQADAGILEPFIEYIGRNLEHSLQLMIKGAKGKNIEDADDVDKEIALLEQRLKTRGKADQIPEKIDYIFENIFIPILQEYQLLTSKLLEFYNNSYIISYNFETHLKPSKEGFEPQLNEYLLKFPYKPGGLDVSFVFSDFNSKGVESFEYVSTFTIRFSSTHFSIDISSTSKTDSIEKEFNTIFPLEEIKFIARKAAKAHSDFIQQKLEAAEQKT